MNGCEGNGGKKFARTFLAGLLSFMVVMIIISSAIAAAYLTTTPEDSPPLCDTFSDDGVVAREANTTGQLHATAMREQIQPPIAVENHTDGQETVTITPSTSEIEVLSFSVNQMTEYSSWTEYVSISGGNPHIEESTISYEDKVVIYDYGESVCENLSYSWRKDNHYGYWDELIEYHCVDHGLPYDVKPYTTKLTVTFSRAENASEYNRCTIFLEYINVTIRFSSGEIGGGYQAKGAGGIGSWSGNTFTASWDYQAYYHYKGNLTVTLSQKPGPRPLVVKIEYPGNGFITRTGENVTIAAKVTDDQNNTVTGSSIDSVTASFTTNAQRTPPNLYLYDDGAHDDGSKDDGFYANVWAPDQTGDYTITVTAKKSGLLDGVDTVNGIMIATPVLEIPAQFKHIHPYKDELGKDAPVFQRGVENPQFKISNLVGAQPSGVKLVIEIWKIFEPIAKNVTVTESWSATPILVEWDWSTNAGPRNPSDIPVGMYTAKAKLVESSTNAILEESYPEYFYVIFNYPWGKGYVTSPKSVVYRQNPNASLVYVAYPLHQYNATLWKVALLTVHGRTKVKDASNDLRLLAYDIGGKGNNYPNNPQKGINAWWYNGGTLRFLEKGSGVCVDYAALMTAYCRAVGIPAGVICGFGMEGNQPNWPLLWAHAWVETWDDSWYWYEPTWDQTNSPWPLGGTYGTDLYAAEGVEFRPRPRYLVAAPEAGGFGPINVYDRYTYCADVANFTFTNEPPGGYDYGQTVQCNVTVANWGSVTISRPLNVSIYEDVIGGLSLTSQFPLRLDRGDRVIANTLDGGRLASESFSWTLPDYGPQNSFYERVFERYVNVVVYYRDLTGRKIQTDSYKKRIPGLCIRPLPLITVDGERRELSNATFTYRDHTDERSLKEETFVLDVPAVVRTRTEHEAVENYSKAVVSIENPDTGAHNYSFSLQLAGRGDALYVPALGSITSNLTGLNITTNYMLTYDQTNGTDDYLSIHEFSTNVTIEDLEFIEYEGVRGMLINVTWNLLLDRHSSQDIAIYFSRRLGDGLSMPEIHTALAEEIVDNGDSLSTLRIATSGQCRVGDTLPINITIFNNGVTHETLNVTVNVTKVIETVPCTVIGLYIGTALTTVPPQTEKNVTFMVAVPELTVSGVWNIAAETNKGIEATSVFNVEDAFDLTCTHNITIPQYSPFTFNATVTNTWDTAVHDVNVTLDFFYGFDESESSEKQLGTLSPGESRIISWQLNATASGELPLDVIVSSSDGGFDTTGSTITSLAPPELWIPNVIIPTPNPDSGTAKTVFLNAAIHNVGDVTAHNVQIQLILPDNVTSTVLTQDIGDLSGGEQKNVSLDITFDTQSDFAFEVIAKDNANHSVTGTVMVSLLGPALPDLTLTSDDILFIPPSSNSSVSASSSKQTTLADTPNQHTLIRSPSVNPSSASEQTKGNLPNAKTATKSIELAKNGARYKEGVSSPGKNKLSSAPLIPPSFAIYNLTYPSTANPSQTFQVVVDTAYTFDTTTGVYVGIWDYDMADYITDTETTLIGLGSARFTFNLTAPASGMMNLSVDLYYWDGFGWIWVDYEDFIVTVTEDQFFSIENVTAPATVNSNQTFQVMVNADYSFETVTYVYAGIWDYDLGGYIAGTSGDDTLFGFGTTSFTFNLSAPASGTMNLSAALWYWDNAWVRTDCENFTVHVTTGKIATLSATIHNIGTVNATNVTVQFFDGDPDTDGIQIGSDQTILSIPRGDGTSAELRWDTTEKVGSHVIYVRIDPSNVLEEANESNNHAFRQIGVPGVTCSDADVTINSAVTSVTDDPVGAGYDMSNAPANVNLIMAKGVTVTATGPDGTYPFYITFSSPVSNSFVLYKLPEWVEIPYTLLDLYTIQVQLEISGGVLDPSFIFTTVGIFDTDPGTYPSISGIHTGTITPTKTLTVSKLYTYPCLGTGGHTEYVKISNDSWSSETLPWSGYVGDWHNISFPGTFILRANETYHYTIKTGSYPQIIHEPSYNATGGIITCIEFVDVNGKQYEDWIPAIRLY